MPKDTPILDPEHIRPHLTVKCLDCMWEGFFDESDIENSLIICSSCGNKNTQAYYQGMKIERLIENCDQCDTPIDTGMPQGRELFISAEDRFCDGCWEQKKLDQIESEKRWKEFRIKMNKAMAILQREYLARKLGGSKFAYWIAYHWPKQWLKEIKRIPDD